MDKIIIFVKVWNWKVGDKTYYKIKYILSDNDNMYENFITEEMYNNLLDSIPYTEMQGHFNIDKDLKLRLYQVTEL